jgi:multidrug efflux pump subunit AcrA (membrane-fusion protein)
VSHAAARRGASCLLAVLLLVGCSGDDRPVVTTERASAGEVVETVTAPARVDAAARQDVAAAVSGTVVAIEVDDGGEIGVGEVAVRLDSSQVALAQQQAAAAQAAAAQVTGIDLDGNGAATVARTHRAVAELDASVGPAIADARTRAAAIEDPDQRAAALAAVESVDAAYRTNRAGILAAGEAIASSQDAAAASLSAALEQAVRQATAAQRVQADAAAAAAAAQAEELNVSSPLAGTVQLGEAAASDGLPLPSLPAGVAGLAGQLGGLAGASGGGTLRVGAPVVAGQTLFTVFDLSRRYVVVDVDEIDAPAIRLGQRARVLVDALGGIELDGIVESIRVEAATTEAGGVGYPVRVRLLDPADDPDAADGLRVGMTASAEIVTATVAADLVVPSRALVRREAGTVVYVVADGRARIVPVTVLALGEDRAAVEPADDAALSAGDRVVTSGYEGLGDGDEVRRAAP